MNRFLKVLLLLIVGLFLLVSGVDATLDHLTRCPTQNSFAWYNEKGDVVLAYNGDAALSKACLKPVQVTVPSFLHRTSYSGPGLSPISTGSDSRWF